MYVMFRNKRLARKLVAAINRYYPREYREWSWDKSYLVAQGDWLGAPVASWEPDGTVTYCTGSGGSHYTIHPDGRIVFDGSRKSLWSGTDAFKALPRNLRVLEYSDSSGAGSPWAPNPEWGKEPEPEAEAPTFPKRRNRKVGGGLTTK